MNLIVASGRAYGFSPQSASPSLSLRW